MAEYIERRALFNRLADYWNIPRDWDGGIAQPCEDAFTIIEDFPAADVEPVRHARWEARGDVFGFVRCSACKDCNIYDEWQDGKKWSHCPHCGARMDLEVSE
jgi:hypothetical protein